MAIEQLGWLLVAAALGAAVAWAFATARLRVAKLETEIAVRDAEARGLATSEQKLAARAANIDEAEAKLANLITSAETELSRLTSLTEEEAREEVLRRAEIESAALRDAKFREAQLEADQAARKLILGAIERTHVALVNEATAAAVLLPSEEMKGRIIGREGRNIRAFEQAAGVDLVIDETPETVVVSSFDPVRREVARIALMNMMLDGRIHPARIEEAIEQAQSELDRVVMESAQQAIETAQVEFLPEPVMMALGRLRFRTSLGQNVLNHSVETALIAARISDELGLNTPVVRTGALLHDIGKSLGEPYEGPHALAGMQFLDDHGLAPSITHTVGAHHEEIPQETDEAKLVAIADSMSAARRGARRESLDTYLQRVRDLELMAGQHPAVERTYAIQAGREIRVFVKPDSLDDMAAQALARDLAKRIEKELDYPGQIKVTIIRESRFSEVAT